MRRVAMVLAVVAGAAACGGGSKVSSNAHTAEFSITDAGCTPDALTVAPGPTVFHVKNSDANNVTEFEVLDHGTIIGEKENLTPGLDGSFTIDLKAGTYTLACPGGTQHATGTLTVTASGGSGSASAPVASEPDHDMNADCVPSASTASTTTRVVATLSDFKIELHDDAVPAGTVEINGTNTGTHPHEIVVVKGVAANALPTEVNGSVDEDKLPAGAKVGELEAFGGGRSCNAQFALTAATYTLFCNVVGTQEGSHFRSGMVTTLTVT